MGDTSKLSSLSAVYALIALVLTCMLSFRIWTPYVGGAPLDQVASPAETIELLQSMIEAQRRSHWWMTITLDSLFILAYSALFALVAQNYWGRLVVPWLIVLACVVIADIAENTAQLFAISGNTVLLDFKALATPFKNTGFSVLLILSACTVLYQSARQILSWRRDRSDR